MFTGFYSHIAAESPVSVIVLSVAIMLFCGFFATRVTKLLRLPNVTAYILTGVVIGPYCCNLIPRSVVQGMDFISDIALAFIAFSAGEFFRLPTLRENGKRVVVITLFESLLATLCIFLLTYCVLRLGLSFSIILAALASATAPASTLMTIRQTNARGDFVDTLLSVVALDDVVSLLAFSVAISISLASTAGSFDGFTIAKPLLLNGLMISVAILLGFLLNRLMTGRSKDNRLIVSVALLFGICGMGAALGVSPLLACMVLGMVYINLSEDEKLFRQLNYFSPPILLLFFVKSGLEFRLDALTDTRHAIAGVPLLLIGVLYFFVRILGKYAGAFLGCRLVRKPRSVSNYLGLALIPQAGVSIGLAALGARLIGGEDGSMLQTVILSSSILYELIGPGCAKLSLYLSGSYGMENPVESSGGDAAKEHFAERRLAEPSLKERLLAIQKALKLQTDPPQGDSLGDGGALDIGETEMDENDFYAYFNRFRRISSRRR